MRLAKSFSLSLSLFSSLLSSLAKLLSSEFVFQCFIFVIRLLLIFRSVSTSAACSGEKGFLGVGVFSFLGSSDFSVSPAGD